MPVPSEAITHLELSATFSEFDAAASRQGFIGGRIFPPVIVSQHSGDVGKLPLEAWLQDEDDVRAPGGEYHRSDFQVEKFTYQTEDHGAENVVDDRQARILGGMFNVADIASGRVMDKVARRYEILAATAIYDTAVWTGAALTTAAAAVWSTAASGKPIADVRAAKEKIRTYGIEPNAVILNQRQLEWALDCAEVLDRIKYFGGDDPKDVTATMCAQIFDVDFVLVSGGFKNTGKVGQSATMGRIFGNTYVTVARVAVTNDPQEPCVGRTFIFSEEGAASPGDDGQLAVIMDEYRAERNRGSVMRGRCDYQIKVMYPQAAHLINTITS